MAPDEAPEGDRAKANKVFDLVTRLVKNCGLEEISGIGMSYPLLFGLVLWRIAIHAMERKLID